MATTPYIKMGKNLRGDLIVWVYDGDSKSGIPLNPLKIRHEIIKKAEDCHGKS